MPNMLAFCDNCRTVFNSGFYFENSTNITLTGNQVQCPKCGRMAKIPDGTYNFVGESIELISGPDITIRRLELYKKIIEQVLKKQQNTEDFTTAIKQDAPELNKISDLLPKTRNEFYAFLSLLLALITLAISKCESKNNQIITVDQVVNNYNSYYVSNKTNISNAIYIDNKLTDKPNRNDKCPCGSGKKYKNCHGKNVETSQ